VSDRQLYYLQDENGEPYSVDMMTWALWFERNDRRIAYDEVGGFSVSTIFLGLDHNWGEGPPVLWETMIFSDGTTWDGHAERYTSRAAALKGHKRAVAIVERVMQEAQARLRRP
jgi:hypothetical protein